MTPKEIGKSGCTDTKWHAALAPTDKKMKNGSWTLYQTPHTHYKSMQPHQQQQVFFSTEQQKKEEMSAINSDFTSYNTQ